MTFERLKLHISADRTRVHYVKRRVREKKTFPYRTYGVTARISLPHAWAQSRMRTWNLRDELDRALAERGAWRQSVTSVGNSLDRFVRLMKNYYL